MTAQNLKACHLSQWGVEEYEVIFANAHILDTPEEKLRAVRLCPSHHFNFGPFWRPVLSGQLSFVMTDAHVYHVM